MKKILSLLAFLLVIGAGCSNQTLPTPAPASPSEEAPQPTQTEEPAFFDTNDYLDAALEELKTIDNTE